MASINIRGIDAYIAHGDGGPGISRVCGEYGPEVQVRFKIPWAAWPEFAPALMGSVQLDDNGNPKRVPPYALPWAPKLHCRSIAEEIPQSPMMQPDGWMMFDETMVTATFSGLPYQVERNDPDGQNDPSGLPYTITKFRVSGQTYKPKEGAYYTEPFGDNAKPLSQGPEGNIAFIKPQIEISMVRLMMPRILLQNATKLYGCVNDDSIRLGDKTFPRGCLLFTGMNTDPRNDPGGLPVYDIEYTFLGRDEQEFNQVQDKDGNYFLVNSKKDGTGKPPYPYADLNLLFSDYDPDEPVI